jgi:RNA polymerase sigma-70 factor (TIGR02960 family)
MTRARAGDGDAFRALTEPHRRELHMHCYRMLGSFQDAEDAVQDTLLAAWQGLAGFQERASLRTWLYRIATNRCLNALRATSRRPAKEWNLAEVEPPEPTGLGEVSWLEPYPDALLEGAVAVPLGPDARYEQTEAISLAFVTALQVLPARQRAVLILRDVLGFHAHEVAELLDSTLESVTSALKRGRATLQRRQPTGPREPAAAPNSPAEHAVAAQLTHAYQSGDIDALVALLTDDVLLTMPPIALEYHGRHAVAGFFANVSFPSRPYLRRHTHTSQRPAGVRGLPPRPHRRPAPRDRPRRPHPRRRPHLRVHPLRNQRAPGIRAPTFTAETASRSAGPVDRRLGVVGLKPRLECRTGEGGVRFGRQAAVLPDLVAGVVRVMCDRWPCCRSDVPIDCRRLNVCGAVGMLTAVLRVGAGQGPRRRTR